MSLLCTFVSIQMRSALQSPNDKNHRFCQNWRLKKLLVIADLSAYQVTLGRQRLSCRQNPSMLSGKSSALVLVGCDCRAEMLKGCNGWNPEQISPAGLWVSTATTLLSAEVWEESLLHVVLIERQSHFMWLHGFGRALWRSQPSCLQMSVSCKTIRNHCWNTHAASTTLELRSGKHQRWLVVLVLVPLSNMWWC